MMILSCNQDSIFYDLSIEPEPKDPLIPGTPTNMILVKNQLFVGTRMSSKIFRYSNVSGNPQWSNLSLPQGSLGDLATDGNYLYVLYFPQGEPLRSSSIKRFDPATGIWDLEFTAPSYSIQSIFGAGGIIFAGGQFLSNYRSFAVFSLDVASSSMTNIKYGTALLTGAARDSGGTIYLATAGSGIFELTSGNTEAVTVSGTAGIIFSGMIETGGAIVAVSNSGSIFTGTSGTFTSFSTGSNYTGALSIWRDRTSQNRSSLLLMGVRGRGTTDKHGYQEMVLDNGRPSSKIKLPGDENPTSVTNKAKYDASLGVHPVETILQVPDSSLGGPIDYNRFSGDPLWEPPIFAGTPKSGLWSYRNGEWNAED